MNVRIQLGRRYEAVEFNLAVKKSTFQSTTIKQKQIDVHEER